MLPFTSLRTRHDNRRLEHAKKRALTAMPAGWGAAAKPVSSSIADLWTRQAGNAIVEVLFVSNIAARWPTSPF